ncbi:hypothetical protein SEA_BAJUNIPER_26 [Microbacterium phage BAjuniper]|nr:hypothetical protein SEA_BAJUNIPER_26 [Microbacterium phage BAjuniper]
MADPITPEDSVLTRAIKDMSFNPWQARPDVPRQQTPAQAYMAQRNYWAEELHRREPASLDIFIENYPPRTDFDGRPGEPRAIAITPAEAVAAGLLEGVELPPPAQAPEPTKRGEVLESAFTIIHGDREKDYGRPIDSFTRLAEALNLVLRDRLKPGQELKPTDAVKLMLAMKLSRLAGGDEKDDTWIDLAGYAALGAEVRDQQ